MKNIIKKFFNKMPSFIRNVLFLIYQKIIYDPYKIYYERKEAKALFQKKINKNLSHLQIVYDYSCSTPTYGDFLYLILISRFFISKGVKINFFIINDKLREDWYVLDEVKREYRYLEHIKLLNSFLNKDFLSVETITFEVLKRKLKENKETDSHLLFSEKIESRRPIYNHGWNLLNNLSMEFSNEIEEGFLFTPKDFNLSFLQDLPDNSFITWHCRKSIKSTSTVRNTTDEEFIKICKHLKILYPAYHIMIISDKVGCEYFKELSINNSLNLLFSKDFSDNFFGDAQLIVNSNYHFALRGGGIDLFAYYSLKPYEAFVCTASERLWSKKKAHPWSLENQELIDIGDSLKLYLPAGNIHLKL